MSVSKPVKIHVLSQIGNGHDEKEIIEISTTGEYFLKGETIYLRYDEEHELGFVKTTVKIAQNNVVVMRSGAVTMKQRFVEGVSTWTDYSTTFGNLKLGTNTRSLSFVIHKLEGRLEIVYDLQIDEKEKHEHHLVIDYKEEQE